MVLHVTLTHPWNVLSAQRRFPKGRDLVKIPEMKRKQVKDDGNMEDSRRNTNTLWSFGSDVALITGRSVGLHMPKQSKKVFWESWKRRLPCMTFTLLSQLVDSNATCVLPNRLYFSPWGRHEARCCPPSTTSFDLQKLSSMQHWPFESGQIVQIVQMSSSELKYFELSHWDILCHKFASTNCVRRDFLARTFQVSRSRGSEQLNACWHPIPSSYQKWYPIWSPYLCIHFTA